MKVLFLSIAFRFKQFVITKIKLYRKLKKKTFLSGNPDFVRGFRNSVRREFLLSGPDCINCMTLGNINMLMASSRAKLLKDKDKS